MNEFRANMNMITNLCDLIKLVRPNKVIYFSPQAIFGEDTNHDDIKETTEAVPVQKNTVSIQIFSSAGSTDDPTRRFFPDSQMRIAPTPDYQARLQ